MMISAIQISYDMDVAVLSTESVLTNESYDSMEQIMYFADTYYDNNGYGLDDQRSGLFT